MKSKHFKPQPIPKTSEEAFDILSTTQDLDDISGILFRFKQLVNVERSVLTSHALQNSRVPNNQEFIDDLDARFNRLQKAVDDGKPYPTLYGDVCKVKDGISVILAYYQSQIKKEQPIASAYLRESLRRGTGELSTLISEISRNKHSTALDEKDSNILAKYTINSCAKSIMKDDVATIASIVQKPFLADHRDDPKFSYLK
ncbi:Uncharacterised protein [Legionella steigerwaltii]|uniref:Uncharacterized protein n=1 Tax=Legionella steigerwaltii TaxID=460 RepID=A0A378L6S9_9GAMM|nr:hypothetical protein [Legionella steigerwaltii]KTD80335.1 hypothetical protein Lstg_0597 [Legionella steigerwaltii]STY22417.1 Uncharacterised protein [Legionella steigerwaltii]